MKKAWQNPIGTIRDVCESDPEQSYHPAIAAFYTTDVPDGTVNGAMFVGGVWVNPAPAPAPAPPPPAPAPVNPTAWLIDIGPFYDRFGVAKMAVLTSVDPAVVAIRSDVSIRKWIDLQRADVAQSLAYIGTKVPSLTAALQASILTAPVIPEENLALRKLYFS